MAIYLSANKTSQQTTVSIEDVRNFVSSIFKINQDISNSREDLKNALSEDLKIEELKAAIITAKEFLCTYIEGHSVYKGYEQKIQELKEERKDLIDDAKERGIPKKEIDTAIKMLKSDIDPDSTTEIYSNIADLIE